MRHRSRAPFVAALALAALLPACRRSEVALERSTSPVTTAPAGAGLRGAPGVGDPYFPQLGNDGYDVTHYDIDLTWDPDAGRISATTTLDLSVDEPLDAFHLDLVGLEVAAVVVDGGPVPHARQGRELLVDPAALLDEGRHEVRVTYAGRPSPLTAGSAVFDVGWKVDGRHAYVVGEPAGAATWFPANDHPTDKATFTISVTVPAGLTAVASGQLVDEEVGPTGTTFVYDAVDPMATYLASVVIGDLVVTRDEGPHGLPLRSAYPRRLAADAAVDFARTAEMIEVFERWFGAYPFEVYGNVVVDEELGFALENQTLSLFGADFVNGRAAIDRIVAHELSHQWYGNSVSLERWSDIWLNEGFATYAEWIWAQEADGVPIAESARAAHGSGRDLDTPPGDPGARELFQDTVYLRGGLTLHALAVAIGGDHFRALLREWAARHRHGTASTEDLVALAEELSGQELDALFETWLYGEGLPPFPD